MTGIPLLGAEDHRMDVAAWLQGLGLERYVPAFRDNDVDAEVLRKLTADDLISIGVTSVGHRRKLLDAIAALGVEVPAAALEVAAPDALTPPEGERRQLTVMFCDLVGSTSLSTRFDPEDLREVIGAYHRAVAEVVAGFDGFVAKYMGDGVLVYFGYPQAHEDDAERAVRAGLASIDAVGRLDVKSTKLQARVGIATGLVVVGDLIGEGSAQEQAVVGETPNLAARLQALATPASLVIAASTRRQIGELFDLADLGPQTLAGFAEPQPAWRVLGESGLLSRFEALRSGTTPLVGRGEELDLLLRRWEQAKTGEGRVVLLSGEPGIGKSRLAAALSERIEGEPHTRLRYFCSPHHQDSALYPLIGQLERAAGFARDDGPDAKLDKVATLLGPADQTGDISLLVELLSLPGGDRFPPLDLSPQRKKERTLAALLRQLEGLARTHPVLMIFDDLHWIDPTSREFLDLFLVQIDRLPVLLIATFRPEFQPPWTGQPHVTVMSLNRLGRGDGATIVERLAGNAALLPPGVIAEIVERTDGVPLFVEEMTKAVLEAGAERGREAAASMPGASLGVPATLHASLMARLDRLGPMAKEIAQIGAAIGREFSFELLAATAAGDAVALQGAIARLVEAGLVFQRGVPPQANFLFKHALVQDAAYGTLLRGPRQLLHARIADALLLPVGAVDPFEVSELFDKPAAIPEIIAHHLENAGRTVEAIKYWREAGEQAVRRAANREAIEHLRRALSLIDTQPETTERLRAELAVLSQLSSALMSVYGWSAPEVGEAIERATLVGHRLESSADLAPSIVNLWFFNIYRGPLERADRISADLFRIARELDDPEILLQAHHTAWPTRWLNGHLAEASDHIDAGLGLYDEERHAHHRYLYLGHDPAMCAMAMDASVQWALGYPVRATHREGEAVALARRSHHPQSVAGALWLVCGAQAGRGDVAAVITGATELLALAEENEHPQSRAIALISLGWALGQSGETAEGIAQLKEGLGIYGKMGARLYMTRFLCFAAETCLVAQHYSEGLEQVARALALAVETGEQFYVSRLHQVRADLLLHAHGPGDEAVEASLQQAIAVARQQKAKGWELPAVSRLARLWHDRGRRDEARDLLAPVYGWFTEGFNTADLIEARALLDELT